MGMSMVGTFMNGLMVVSTFLFLRTVANWQRERAQDEKVIQYWRSRSTDFSDELSLMWYLTSSQMQQFSTKEEKEVNRAWLVAQSHEAAVRMWKSMVLLHMSPANVGHIPADVMRYGLSSADARKEGWRQLVYMTYRAVDVLLRDPSLRADGTPLLNEAWRAHLVRLVELNDARREGSGEPDKRVRRAPRPCRHDED